MFDVDPKARADLKPGTLYAVAGEGKWVYYGQVTPDKSVGFFKRRDRDITPSEEVLAAPLMAVIGVAYPSIGRALRAGSWKKLGRYPLPEPLRSPRATVQWPVGTLQVTVWLGGVPKYETTVDDPAIQNMERMASLDAEDHVPQRLTADFGAEKAEWHIGGPIWRERWIKEQYALRFPDAPWHKLPTEWVPTNIG
jgi:hypothetical protein